MSVIIKNKAGNIVEVSEERYQRMAARGEVAEVVSGLEKKSSVETIVGEEEVAPVQKFVCDTCGKVFDKEKSLRMHRLVKKH